MIKLPVFKDKKCSYLYNNFVCWDCAASQIPQLYLEKNNFFANASICLDSFQYIKIFSESLISSDFSTFGTGPDILINVLEDCVVFLIWTGLALFNFHFKQKQRFSVWRFTENASFIILQWRNLI